MKKNHLPAYIVTSLLLLAAPFTLHAKEISAAVGMSLAPYIIQKNNSGIEIDIVKAALAYRNHSLTLRYPPLKQVPVLYEKKAVDAALTVSKNFGLDACLSDIAIYYQNYAITLSKSKLIINSLADLSGKRVIAFQNATKYLGPAYKKAVSEATYSEVAQQIHQVNRLYTGRDDIVIADKKIFLYYKAKTTKVNTDQALTFHPLFPPSAYRVAFRDRQVCNDFNEGLLALKKSGQIEKIMARYLKHEPNHTY